MNSFRLLKIIFVILMLVTLGEFSYYIYYQSRIKKKQRPSLISDNSAVAPIKNPKISEEDMILLEDSYYQHFLPISYDTDRDRFYLDIPGNAYVGWRKRMGVDFASWISMSSYTKDQVESLILIERLKGTILKLESKSFDGEKYLYFELAGERGMSTEYRENEDALKKTNFFKIVNGEETPSGIEELKQGDRIIIEAKLDLTKPPKDPNTVIEKKFIIL